MATAREKKVLALLSLLFFLSLGYRIFHPWEQKRVEKLTHTGEREPPVPEKESQGPETGDVMLNIFLSPRKHSGKARNENFFQTVPGLEVQSGNPSLSPSAPPAVPEPVVPAELPEEEIYRDMDGLQVAGIYMSGADLAVFLQREKQIMVIRRGDRIDGKYLVEKLTSEALTLRSGKNEKTVVIDLKQFLKDHERKL